MESCQAVVQPVRQRIPTDESPLQGRSRSGQLICVGLEAA